MMQKQINGTLQLNDKGKKSDIFCTYINKGQILFALIMMKENKILGTYNDKEINRSYFALSSTSCASGSLFI